MKSLSYTINNDTPPAKLHRRNWRQPLLSDRGYFKTGRWLDVLAKGFVPDPRLDICKIELWSASKALPYIQDMFSYLVCLTQVASLRYNSVEACKFTQGTHKGLFVLRLGMMKADSMGLFGAWLIDMLQTFGLAACQGDKKADIRKNNGQRGSITWSPSKLS